MESVMNNTYSDAILTTCHNNATKSNKVGWFEEYIHHRLQQRIKKGTLRQLPATISLTTSTALNINNLETVIADTSRQKTTTTSLPKTTKNLSGIQVMDFASNDYLGLAHDIEQYKMVENCMKEYIQKQLSQQHLSQQEQLQPLLGSTGSRLLSGDHRSTHELESYLCRIHQSEMSLVCNSGYDANLSVVSTLPCTCILYDTYIHNSLHMGIRLWYNHNQSNHDDHDATSYRDASTSMTTTTTTTRQTVYESFQHNNVIDLQRKLEYYHKMNHTIIVLVESIYSMDGDIAPIQSILDVAYLYHSLVVVDEAHGFGIYGHDTVDKKRQCSNDKFLIVDGMGVLAMNRCQQHPALLVAIYTYGKAAGCHGAVITSSYSKQYKDYLINYAYPIIYTTTLPLHSIITIRCSYETITGPIGQRLRQHLYHLIRYFDTKIRHILFKLQSKTHHKYRLIPSTSPIQALIVPGNAQCTIFCNILYEKSNMRIRLFPIKSPTVPIDEERIRIVLHAHNTIQQIDMLVQYIDETFQDLLLQQSTTEMNDVKSYTKVITTKQLSKL